MFINEYEMHRLAKSRQAELLAEKENYRIYTRKPRKSLFPVIGAILSIIGKLLVNLGRRLQGSSRRLAGVS